MKKNLKLFSYVLLLICSPLLFIMVNCDGGSTASNSMAAPENLQAVKISDTAIEISWEYSISEDADIVFTIARKKGNESWNNQYRTTDLTSFMENISADDSSIYVYKIKVEDITMETESDFSDIEVYFTDISIPSNIIAEIISVESIIISWEDGCVGEDGYKIDKKIGQGKWQTEYKILEKNSTSVNDTAAFSDTLYYRVYAYVGDNNSTYGEVNIVSTFPAPANLVFTKLSWNQIQLNWDDNSGGEYGVKVDRNVDQSGWDVGYATVDPGITKWIDENVEINTSIEYRIYTYSGQYLSNYLETGIIDNILPAPYNLNVNKLDETTLKIAWEDLGPEGGTYTIDRKIGNSEWDINYKSVVGEKYYIDNIEEPCGTFIYKVRASSGDVYSEYSNLDTINVRLELVGSISTEGDATRVFVKGWYAYIADNYNGLVIADCSNPSSPAEYGVVEIPDRTKSAYVNDDFIYATNHIGGVNIIDFASKEIVGSCLTKGIANDIYVEGAPPFAYVAESDSGISVISLSSSTPARIGYFKPTNIIFGEKALKLYTRGNYLYVAYGSRGFLIFDVSDPTAPTLISELSLGFDVLDVSIVGNYAYCACS